MKPLVLVVNGINTPPAYPLEREVRKTLLENDIDVDVCSGRWVSTGSIRRDIQKTLFNRQWREEQIGIVQKALVQLADNIEDRECMGCVLAHSMGSVFAAEAERREQTHLPFVFVGSPYNHPIWKAALATAGLMRSMPLTPWNFHNDDDPVTTSKFLGARPPSWMKNERVAIAGHAGLAKEHMISEYIMHPNVLGELRELLWPEED